MNLTTMHDVATAIRNARLAQGLTQAQLASRLGVGRDWVIRLEQGSPRLEASKVLDAFVALGLSLEAAPAPSQPARTDDPFASIFEALT